ncbi:serine/threonine-protein phosphatase 4 regulatory subunit 1 isoform X8 [Latimeria chalumnae]|uniref:serine/threonine-protein phosphatase 4 regulatory subunit 1 isoform X8 n=1 Tax=Latimeria chalumnae TaxID=7897 RepID=UPI00313CDC9D
MADLSLFQEDLQEEIDGFGVDDYSSESDVIIIPSALDFVSQDEMLTPLGRLDKYAASENIFNRQMVARSLLDTLRAVSDDEGDCIAVLERVSRLAEDSEPTVRAELMEQVPHIAMFFQENRTSIPYAFSKYLLPIVVRYLADQNNQVRKTSQAALLVLLEQELVERYDVETSVCPVLGDLTAPDSNDDVKTEAVAIMCKMAPMVGKDITERLILPRFCEMCCDCRMFHVRKVCAANFGDICSVVGREATEEMLLPRFFQLCSDNVWGVRKACAECFMAVSCATSQEVRRTKLSSLFSNLISDPSRWVRQAAFQSLGPFISTFANPSSSSQFFKEEENRSTEDSKATESRNSSESTVHEIDAADEVLKDEMEEPKEHASAGAQLVARTVDGDVCTIKAVMVLDSECNSQTSMSEHCVSSSETCGETINDSSERLPVSGNDESAAPWELSSSSGSTSIPEPELYNSFHYWRTPIPKIDLDFELMPLAEVPDKPKAQEATQETAKSGPSNILTATRKELEEMIENLEPHIDDPDVKAQVDVLSAALRASSLDSSDELTAENLDTSIVSHNEASVGDQLNCTLLCEDSVPLITDTVQSMSATLHYIHETSDLSADCSFSPEEEKKSKVQWKVRRTLAFSIHELAIILGDQLTAADLVPIFNGFLKDLDEVRIGVLKHLYDFLKLLQVEKRKEYLYQLQEFLVTDNSRNWRFRAELAEQLVLLLGLYSARDIFDYLRPIALSLCADRVSSVRWIAYKLVSEMIKKLYLAPVQTLAVDCMKELVEKFCHCSKWSGRQSFVFVCQAIIEDECIPMEQFAVHLMPHLLQLASDRVPNVRVLLAKTLRQSLIEKEYFLNSSNSHQEAVEQTVMALQMDYDNDVKYFASVHPAITKLADDAMSTASSTY